MNYMISGCWSGRETSGAVVSLGLPWRDVDVTSRRRHIALPRRRTGDVGHCTASRFRWPPRRGSPSPRRHVDDDDVGWWRHEIGGGEATTVDQKMKVKVEKSRSKGQWDDVGRQRGSRWPARHTSTRSAGRRSAASYNIKPLLQLNVTYNRITITIYIVVITELDDDLQQRPHHPQRSSMTDLSCVTRFNLINNIVLWSIGYIIHSHRDVKIPLDCETTFN